MFRQCVDGCCSSVYFFFVVERRQIERRAEHQVKVVVVVVVLVVVFERGIHRSCEHLMAARKTRSFEEISVDHYTLILVLCDGDYVVLVALDVRVVDRHELTDVLLTIFWNSQTRQVEGRRDRADGRWSWFGWGERLREDNWFNLVNVKI